MNRRNSVVLLQSIAGTTLDDFDNGHDGELSQHQSQLQSQGLAPMAPLNTAHSETHKQDTDKMERRRGIGRIVPCKIMKFLNGR